MIYFQNQWILTDKEIVAKIYSVCTVVTVDDVAVEAQTKIYLQDFLRGLCGYVTL